MGHAHPPEVGEVIGRGGLDDLPSRVSVDIERNGGPPGVEPDQGLVVGGENGVLGELGTEPGEELRPVQRDGVSGGTPPTVRESPDIVARVPAGQEVAHYQGGQAELAMPTER